MIGSPAMASAARLLADVLLASSVYALVIVCLAWGAMGVARHRPARLRHRIGYLALLLIAVATAAIATRTVRVWRLHQHAYSSPPDPGAVGAGAMVHDAVITAPPAWTRPASALWLRVPARWEAAIGALWIAGVVILAFRLVVESRRWRRLIRRAGPADPWLRHRLQLLTARAGLRAPVELLLSDDVPGPLVVGWIRPRIVVGRAVLAVLDSESLELLLLHELAHVRRRDGLASVLLLLPELALFFHPGVRWLLASVRHECECACDERVIEAVPAGRAGYGRALYRLGRLEHLMVSGRVCPATGGRLVERVRRIVSADSSSDRWAVPSLGFEAAVVTLLLVTLAQVGIAASFAGDLVMRRDIALRSVAAIGMSLTAM